MNSTITQIASDLNERVDNRYQLVLEVSELAKRLLEEAAEKQSAMAFSGSSSTSAEKVIYQALIMKASEIDIGNGLIG
ncbi:MAG: hypothetical protein KTR14_00815 [Vampirovibrio sp.]|nr:hypothetical protein [Vampirovibrio sp.]